MGFKGGVRMKSKGKKMPSKNEECSCGSGESYSDCCGAD